MKRLMLFLIIILSFTACSSSKKNVDQNNNSNGIGSTGNENKDGSNNKNGNKSKITINGDLLSNVEIPKTLSDAIVVAIDEANTGLSDLVSKLKEKKPISFSDITQFFITKHLKMYEKVSPPPKESVTSSRTALKLKFDMIEGKIKEKDDLHTLKIQMEEAIGGIKNYNRDSVTIPDVLYHQKIQCYSGTSTYESIVRDVLTAKAYMEKNMVVIMSNGHITPGYLQKDADDWTLTGIEITNKGKAKVKYGKVKELDKLDPVRIIDANLWMIMEVIVPYLLESPIVDKSKLNGPKIIREALDITNAMYDGQIPVEKLEEKIKKIQDDLIPNSSSDAVNFGGVVSNVKGGEPTFGSFGKAIVDEGDLPINEMEETDYTKSDTYRTTLQPEMPTTSKPTATPYESYEGREYIYSANAPEKLEKFFKLAQEIIKNDYKMEPTEFDQDCKVLMGQMQGEWSLMLIKANGYKLPDCKLDFSSTFRASIMHKTNSNCHTTEKNGLQCSNISEYAYDEGYFDLVQKSGNFYYLGSVDPVCVFKISINIPTLYPADYLIGIDLESDREKMIKPMFFTKYNKGDLNNLCQLGTGLFSR